MKKNKGTSKIAVTLGYLALLVGGFAVALVVLRTTSLPERLGITREEGESTPVVSKVVIDPNQNDGLKAEVAEEEGKISSLKSELGKTLERVGIREQEVSSLEVKSREGELDFTRFNRDLDLTFLKGSVESNNRLLAGVAHLRDELKEMRELLNSISLTKSKLAAEWAKYQAKEEEFKQALDQRLSVGKEIVLYLLTLKFVWGLFTGYARTHYPYLQRENALKAAANYEKESKLLKVQLAELASKLEAKLRGLEKLAGKLANEVVAKERPSLLTLFNVDFVKPVSQLVAELDATRVAVKELDSYKGRVESLRKSSAGYNPQYTPGSYITTLGQALFNYEETSLEDTKSELEARLKAIEDEGILDLVNRLSDFVNGFTAKINQFDFLSKLAESWPNTPKDES